MPSSSEFSSATAAGSAAGAATGVCPGACAAAPPAITIATARASAPARAARTIDEWISFIESSPPDSPVTLIHPRLPVPLRGPATGRWQGRTFDSDRSAAALRPGVRTRGDLPATRRYDEAMDRTRVTGVVLAGGRSSRLGRDKALLTLDGEPLLARTVRLLHGLADDVIVLGPPERGALAPGARVLPDERPGDGPLPALATALREMRGERLVAVATDMPLLNPSLLAYLLDRSEG